jgi:dsDNA-specific endonuclease/ATPase MutS2
MRLSLLQWLGRNWRALRRTAPNNATHDQLDLSTEHTSDDEDVDESVDENVDESDDINFFPEPVRLEITDVFDLHTIAPRDVERVVHEYLAEAQRAGFRSVRIIHGKGQGVQRRLVQSILARTPFVLDWTDAPPQSGGWGATVAHLKIEKY